MPCNVSADGRNSASPTKPFDYGTRQPMLKRTDQETLEILNRVRVFVASASCRHRQQCILPRLDRHDLAVLSRKPFGQTGRLRPRQLHHSHPVLRTFGTRWTGMQDGLILAGVQAPPAPLCLVVVSLPFAPHSAHAQLSTSPCSR
jgi:hypothetical protein